MHIKDLFGASVRMLGIYVLLRAWWHASAAVVLLLRLPVPVPNNALVPSQMLGTVQDLIGGTTLFFGANWIASFAYKGQSPNAN